MSKQDYENGLKVRTEVMGEAFCKTCPRKYRALYPAFTRLD